MKLKSRAGNVEAVRFEYLEDDMAMDGIYEDQLPLGPPTVPPPAKHPTVEPRGSSSGGSAAAGGIIASSHGLDKPIPLPAMRPSGESGGRVTVLYPGRMQRQQMEPTVAAPHAKDAHRPGR